MTDIYSFQGAETRLCREAGYGVLPGSPKYVRLNGFGVRLKPEIENDLFAPPGALVPTIGTTNDDYATGKYEGVVDFNALPFAISGMLGNPTIQSLGSGAYQWDWAWDGRRPLRPVSYAAHYGYPDVADIVSGLIFNNMKLSGGREDGFEVSGDAFAKGMTVGQAMGGITSEVQTVTKTGTVSGGTFTITVVETGETTAAIQYNDNAATIQAAITALASIEPGEIVVGGGPISTTPATFTYTGPYFAGKNVAQLTVDSSSLTGGGSYTVTTTTPGADAVIDIPPTPAGATIADVYLDSTWAGLGTTQLVHALTSELQIGDRLSRVRPLNKSKSSDTVIDIAKQEHTLGLTLGINAVERARLAKIRANTKEFARVQWTGDLIGGSNYYTLRTDACLLWQNPGDPEEEQGALARMWTGQIAIDQTSKQALAIRIINTQSTLSPLS